MSYWLYKIDKKYWEEFLKFDNFYISTRIKYDITIGDYIIFYTSGAKSGDGGFVGYSSFKTELIKNTKDRIKIFSSKAMNNYIAKLNEIIIIEEPITVSEVIDYIKGDIKEFKNKASFSLNYLNKSQNLKKITIKGKELLDRLIHLTDEDITSESSVSSPSYDSSDILNTSDLEPTTDTITDELSDESEDESEDESSDSSDDEDNTGMIPIMVIPCEKFKIPNKNRITYFKNHILKCTECNIINNNNICPLLIINNKNSKFSIIKKKNDLEFNESFNRYDALKKYEPMDTNNRPFIKIIYINNDHDTHNNCIMIQWALT